MMMLLTRFVLLLAVPAFTSQLSFEYLDHTDLYKHLKNVTNNSEIAQLESIGKSQQKRLLFVVKITNERYKAILKPNVKFIGNIHGHSLGGRNLLINLVEYLLENFGKNDTVTNLVNTTVIHIFCSMNPDGFEIRSTLEKISSMNRVKFIQDTLGADNHNSVNLNTDFDWKSGASIHGEPETKATIEWLNHYPFILSATFFSGKVVVSYPFYQDHGMGSLTPDDEIFRFVVLLSRLRRYPRNILI